MIVTTEFSPRPTPESWESFARKGLQTFKGQDISHGPSSHKTNSWVNCEDLPQQKKIPKRYDSKEERLVGDFDADDFSLSPSPPPPPPPPELTTGKTIAGPMPPPPPPRVTPTSSSATLPRVAKKQSPPVPARTDASLPRRRRWCNKCVAKSVVKDWKLESVLMTNNTMWLLARKVGVQVLGGHVPTFHLASIMEGIPHLFQIYLLPTVWSSSDTRLHSRNWKKVLAENVLSADGSYHISNILNGLLGMHTCGNVYRVPLSYWLFSDWTDQFMQFVPWIKLMWNYHPKCFIHVAAAEADDGLTFYIHFIHYPRGLYLPLRILNVNGLHLF